MLSRTVEAECYLPNAQPDAVELACLESFPASDPPSWVGAAPGTPASTPPGTPPSTPRYESGRRPDESGKVAAFKPRLARDNRNPAAEPVALPTQLPYPAQGVPVHIYRSSPAVLQGGRGGRDWVLEFEPQQPSDIEPLMGWTRSRDPLQQVRLTFPSRDRAIAFALRQGWRYSVSSPHEHKLRPKFPVETCRPALAAENAPLAVGS